MVRTEKRGGKQRLRVEGNMTVYTAAALRRELLDAIAGGRETEIDLTQVGEMDGAGLQLLILARREAGRLNRRLCVTAASVAAREVLELSGTAAYLGAAKQ